MKKAYNFFVCFAVLFFSSAWVFVQETYCPGKVAVYEYPAHEVSQGIQQKNKLPLVYNPDTPEICLVHKVTLVKKDNRYFWRIEFIPWLEGENTIPEIILGNEKIPALTVTAHINKKALLVPPRKMMESHEGLYIRLLLYTMLMILGTAFIIFAAVKRKIIISTVILYCTLVWEQYKLITNLATLENDDWKSLDHAARRYCDAVSRALSQHSAYNNVIGYIPARNLTAHEIAMDVHIPPECRIKIAELFMSIEGARWLNKHENFLLCCKTTRELPAVFANLLSKVNET